MDDKQFRELIDRYAMEQMADDLEHNSWVVVQWSKGKSEGSPEVAYGPYGSAVEALTKAEKVRLQIESAPGAQTFMAGYKPTINIVPVFGDEEDEDG